MLLRLRLPVSAGLLLAMLRRKEEGRRREEAAKLDLFGTTVRDPTPWNAVEEGATLAVPQLGEEGNRNVRDGPLVESRRRIAGLENSSRHRAGGLGARSLPPTAPGSKMAAPADMTQHAPEFPSLADGQSETPRWARNSSS